MTVGAGTRLGPYEILSPLGAGGMGEVFRARDTRLSREVAIKVLPAMFASDPERLRRFEKEARSASALNHPNIVTIYDIGSEGGVSYIAMEKVDGETLRNLLAGGALSAKRLLPIATQIADGLSKAHEAGIVHRDLKPENVMVTKDGLVKILDFGLAKLTSTMSGSDEGSHLPTVTGTSPGVILGTVGYMSPEQASGQAIDFRSDQFAFGSIVYELATGKRAFLKKTAIDTLSAILNEEPEAIASVNPQAPAPLRWIVERCLAKDPEGRYASTKDLAHDLVSVAAHLSEAMPSATARAAPRSARRGALQFAAAALLLAAAVFAGLRLGRSASTAAAPRFQQVTFQKVNIHTATFAPDGQTIVYAARRADGALELFQTRPGSRGSRALGISGAFVTSISASGEMALIEEADETLVTAPLGGGEPRPVAEGVAFADWAPDGKTLAVLRGAAGRRSRLEFPVGTPIYEDANGRIQVSPTGDRVAFRAKAAIGVVDRAKKAAILTQSGQEFGWSPDGAEVWFTRISGGSTHLFAVNLKGRERPLYSLPGDFTLYDVSREGRLLFERGFDQWEAFGRFPGDPRERGYKWLDATVINDLSDDGKTVLFVEKEPGWKNAMSYLRKTDGSPAVPLTEGWCMAISPDGKRAICREDLQAQTFKVVSTSGESRDLPNGGVGLAMGANPSWLPDGKRIVFNAGSPKAPSRIYVQSVDGSMPQPISPEGVRTPGFGKPASPDGRLVLGFDGPRAALYPVSGGPANPIPGLGEGDLPMRWTADGKSLYVRREDAPTKIWIVDVADGKRRVFKELQAPDSWVGPGGWLFNLFITPDGSSYAGTYQNFLADLFVLDGVR